MKENTSPQWTAERGKKLEIPPEYTEGLKYRAIYTIGNNTFTAWGKDYEADASGPRLIDVLVDTSQRVQGIALNQQFTYRKFLDLYGVQAIIIPLDHGKRPTVWDRFRELKAKYKRRSEKGSGPVQAQKVTPDGPAEKGNPFQPLVSGFLALGIVFWLAAIGLAASMSFLYNAFYAGNLLAALFSAAAGSAFLIAIISIIANKQQDPPLNLGPHYEPGVKITGSWFINPARVNALDSFELVKNAKLRARHLKYNNTDANLENVLIHLNQEVRELFDALKAGQTGDEVLKELADVSNCCDLAFYLISTGALDLAG